MLTVVQSTCFVSVCIVSIPQGKNKKIRSYTLFPVPSRRALNGVLLNVLFFGKHLFCNTKTIAIELLEFGLEPCHVNQGYTKCSALPLGNQALITSDTSIAKCAKEHGIDVLQIQEGHITLPGYDYGFIGGCASFAPRGGINTVFFCGDLSGHPDAHKIESFCDFHNFGIINLSQNRLFDTGTIFMI